MCEWERRDGIMRILVNIGAHGVFALPVSLIVEWLFSLLSLNTERTCNTLLFLSLHDYSILISWYSLTRSHIFHSVDPDDESILPSKEQWGRKRKDFYKSGYVDNDYGGVGSSDEEELAHLEEVKHFIYSKKGWVCEYRNSSLFRWFMHLLHCEYHTKSPSDGISPSWIPFLFCVREWAFLWYLNGKTENEQKESSVLIFTLFLLFLSSSIIQNPIIVPSLSYMLCVFSDVIIWNSRSNSITYNPPHSILSFPIFSFPFHLISYSFHLNLPKSAHLIHLFSFLCLSIPT